MSLDIIKQHDNKYLLTKQESGHWYAVSSSGEVTSRYDADLRIARKQGLFISPTTIYKAVRANGGLDLWKENQLLKAFFSTVRYMDEDDKAFAKRLKDIAMSKGSDAASFGTRVHDAIEHYPEVPSDESILYQYTQYAQWHEENIIEVLSSEKMVAHRGIGVAGRCDRIAIHKDYGPVVIDIKTMDVKEGKKPKPYESWCPQLAFYAYAEIHNGNLANVPTCINVVIDSNGVHPLTPIVWTPQDVAAGWKDFLATAWLWFTEKDYWPTGEEWGPTFSFKDGTVY